MARSTLAPFRHAWPHLRRQRGLLLLGLACLIPAKLIDLTIPLLWKRGFDGAIDRSLGVWDEVRLALLALGIGVVSSLLAYATRRFLVNASREFERDLRLTLHQKLLTLPPQWFGGTTVGDLVSRMTQDIEAVRMLGPGLMYLMNALVALVGAFAFMIWHDPRLTLWMGGTPESDNVYARAELAATGRPKQRLQLWNREHGPVVDLPIHLDFGYAPPTPYFGRRHDQKRR